MKKIVHYEGREFVCYVRCPFEGMVSVIVWETKRPKWIIFKHSYCDSFDFILEPDTTIDDCVKQSIWRFVADEEAVERLHSKWKDFEKTVDNPLEM